MSIWEKAKYTSIITLFITLSYFAIQNLVPFTSLDLTLPVDGQIPFVPEFIWLYHTLTPVLVISCIFLIKRKSIFYTSCISFLLAASVLNIFYVILPSFYPREDFIIEGVSSWLVSLTRELDGSNNTFPSGHVALSWLLFFSIQGVDSIKKSTLAKWAFFSWASLISLSTLFLKQHYFVDVVSGVALACLCHKFAQRIYYMKKKPAWIAGNPEQAGAQLAE